MFNEVIAKEIKTGRMPLPFDLEIWILEQKLIKAQANTDKMIKLLSK